MRVRVAYLLFTSVMVVSFTASAYEFGTGSQFAIITLRPESVVRGPTLQLGDLADIQGEGTENLRNIDLGFAALPGRAKNIHTDIIRAHIEKSGYMSESVRLEGPGYIKAITAHYEISSETVRQSLRDYVEMEMPWDPSRSIVDVSVPSFTSIVPTGDVSFHWRPNPQYRFLGHGAVYGEIRVNDRTERTLTCRVFVEAFAPVVIADTQIKRGDMLSTRDFVIEERPLSTLGRDVLTSLSELKGKVAHRSLFPDQVVTRRHIASPVLVRRNQIVTVEAAQGGLIVRGRAKALNDAGVDDFVTCMSLNSKEQFSGVVRVDGIVVVD